MTLTVLSVAYPFAGVSADSVGGAEQVLSHIDRALVEAGHHSIVIAAEGSEVGGTLVPVPLRTGPLGEAAREHAWAAHRRAIADTLQRFRPDIVHMHGVDFDAYLPAPGVPVLVTLHLPPDWYRPGALDSVRPRTFFHCVSETQRRRCPASPNFLPVIPNGVPVRQLSSARHATRKFALQLGRICPEKGMHLALRAARQANMPLLIGGELFPYAGHVRYFEQDVRPLLDARRKFLGPLGFARKRRLLAAAHCLLVPSTAPETSSLVAMEAAACGTPVIAFASGALPEIVEHGRTGFVVRDADEMAEAIVRAQDIDPALCRAVAQRRFDVRTMTERYLAAYRQLAPRGAERAALRDAS